MSAEARIVLSPIRWDHAPGAAPIDADCGHRAWIMPVSLNAVLHPFMITKTVCMDCLIHDPELRRSFRHDMEKHRLRALPGAKDELVAALGQEEADSIYRLFNVDEDWL